MHAYMYACTYATYFLHVCEFPSCVCVLQCRRAHMPTRTHTNLHIRVSTHTHTCTHTHTHTHTHFGTCTPHSCVCVALCKRAHIFICMRPCMRVWAILKNVLSNALRNRIACESFLCTHFENRSAHFSKCAERFSKCVHISMLICVGV